MRRSTLNASIGGGRTLSAVMPECRRVFGGAYVPDYNCGLIHFWKAHVMSVNFTEGFLRGCECFAPPRKVLPDALDPEGP